MMSKESFQTRNLAMYKMMFGADTLQLDSLEKHKLVLTPEKPKNKKPAAIKKPPKNQ